MSELNPCPGCGREPDFEEGKNVFRVACWRCDSIDYITSRSASGAISAWNAATSDDRSAPDKKTLRDEFAMAALSGLLANGYDPFGFDLAAKRVYLIADAMIKERSK